MDHILEGAARALEEKGVDFTMDYLAKSIHISKRTIYEKYNSKEEIISLILKLKMQAIHEQHRQILEDENLDLEDKLVAYFSVASRVFNTLETDKIRSIVCKVPALIPQLHESASKDWKLLRKFMEEEIAKGKVREIDIDSFIFTFKSLQYHMIEHTDYTFAQMHNILRQAINQLLHGVVRR